MLRSGLGARIAMSYILTGLLLWKVVRCPMMIERCSRWGAGQRRGHAIKLLLAFGLCAVAWPAGAQPALPRVRVSLGDCGSAVHLLARDAHLSEVIRSLSESLQFDVRFEASSDPVVNLDLSLPPAELVAKLSPLDSVIVSQSRDPRCPRHYRVAKVWVLPKAEAGRSDRNPPAQTAQARQTPPPPIQQPQPTQETQQEQSRRYDRMSKQAR